MVGMSLSIAMLGRLRSAGFTEEQAQVVAEVVEEVVKANQQELATKADMLAMKVDLQKELTAAVYKLSGMIIGAVVAIVIAIIRL